jgi:hypothetical protein
VKQSKLECPTLGSQIFASKAGAYPSGTPYIFPSSLTVGQTKLECLTLANFQARLIFVSKAKAYPRGTLCAFSYSLTV